MTPRPFEGEKNIFRENSDNPTHRKNESTATTKRHPDFERMEKPFGLEIHHVATFLLVHSHIFAVYAIYLMITGKVQLTTLIIDLFFAVFSGLGLTVGCHRYWSHKSFKAKQPLQILLMIMQTTSLQLSIHKWCLDHRIHHKYTDTDKDPVNSKRGFFFSHMGWLFTKPHPDYQKAWEEFQAPDLENDPIVRFQSRWYWTLVFVFHTVIPVAILYHFWELPLLYCIAINYRRYVIVLHAAFSVNSFAHMYGAKPYDKNISPVESAIVSFFAGGEGWHNYHHTFPWDYKASEFGWKINVSTMFIELFAWLGWAYDLRTVSEKTMKERLLRTGDGSHVFAKAEHENDS